jgi:glycosyltransferase involved in cell wall biosynthesis
MSTPSFSVVIPAFNEEEYLPRLLDTIERARERYGCGADSVEVIVADNCSTDAAARIAADRGCIVVSVEKRAIGAVRNGGARNARGAILAFVDADTQVHADTFIEIADVLNDATVVGGATGIRFERSSPGIKLTFAMLVIAGSLVRIAIGERPTTNVDTGVTFCRRRDFEEIGGYSEERLFAEDAQFLIDLKRLGRRRHQRFAPAMKAKAIFSTRKFDKYGDWHYFPLSARMIASALRHGGVTAWARRYWYEER